MTSYIVVYSLRDDTIMYLSPTVRDKTLREEAIKMILPPEKIVHQVGDRSRFVRIGQYLCLVTTSGLLHSLFIYTGKPYAQDIYFDAEKLLYCTPSSEVGCLEVTWPNNG